MRKVHEGAADAVGFCLSLFLSVFLSLPFPFPRTTLFLFHRVRQRCTHKINNWLNQAYSARATLRLPFNYPNSGHRGERARPGYKIPNRLRLAYLRSICVRDERRVCPLAVAHHSASPVAGGDSFHLKVRYQRIYAGTCDKSRNPPCRVRNTDLSRWRRRRRRRCRALTSVTARERERERDAPSV